jgi:hypothetical protein
VKDLIIASKPFTGFVDAGRARGSGFLVPGGGFVTCHHVIQNSSNVTVVLGDRSLRAQVRVRSPEYDLAVLGLAGRGEAPGDGLNLGTFADVAEGDDLLILGFPAGEPTLTALRGMAAAKTTVKFNATGRPIAVIKLDAAVAPGFSGGPCIHGPSGKVVGVVSTQVPAAAVLQDVLGKIQQLVSDAEELEKELQKAAGEIGARSGGVWISGVDPNAALAYICRRLAKVASDFKAVGEGLSQFAQRIPLGIGYAISIDYYTELAMNPRPMGAP